MIHKRSLIDILNQVVSGMDRTILIQSVVDNGGNNYTLTVDDLKWIEPGRTLTIGSGTFTILTIDDELNQLTVSGTTAMLSNVTSFEAYTPFFYYGTPIAAETELQKIQLSKDKTPMIYLMLKFTEKFSTDLESMIERESTCNLFFLTQADFEAWETGDFYSNAIRPMRRLQECFVDAISNDYRFDTSDYTFTITDLPMFGVYINTKGAATTWFTDKLSGVQMDSILKITRTSDCDSATERRAGIGFDTIGTDNSVN